LEPSELLEIVDRGEDGKNQFKANFSNSDSMGAEIVAFSNSGGGRIFIGVGDDGAILGLSHQDIRKLNQMVSNVSTEGIRPAINPSTENVKVADAIVMVVSVPDGLRKPYMDNKGAIWVKSGSDKRRATSQEELQRIFQRAGLIHGDEIPVSGLTVSDIDLDYFRRFYQDYFGESLDQSRESISSVLRNMNLATEEGSLNIAGALLFAKDPRYRLPAFMVKAVAFPGDNIEDTDYLDSRDISGKIGDVFQQVIGFISNNTKRLQGGQGFNSIGEWEIPRDALEELVANALIHRDFFISAPVRVLVFRNRIEIISPGHLPNNLTIENIKYGNSNIRNPILATFATRILPYRGLGSGIRRALQSYPDIEFKDDRDGNLFVVTIRRKTE